MSSYNNNVKNKIKGIFKNHKVLDLSNTVVTNLRLALQLMERGESDPNIITFMVKDEKNSIVFDINKCDYKIQISHLDNWYGFNDIESIKECHIRLAEKKCQEYECGICYEKYEVIERVGCCGESICEKCAITVMGDDGRINKCPFCRQFAGNHIDVINIMKNTGMPDDMIDRYKKEPMVKTFFDFIVTAALKSRH